MASVRRYAQAAFAIAIERDALDVWERDLENARPPSSPNPMFSAFMAAPSVPINVQARRR